VDLNEAVDSVLRTIRQTSSALGGAFARRRIAFTSFSPEACVALNWKQPNCQCFPTRIMEPDLISLYDQILCSFHLNVAKLTRGNERRRDTVLMI
jgi:hypothetical protein